MPFQIFFRNTIHTINLELGRIMAVDGIGDLHNSLLVKLGDVDDQA